MSCTVLPPFSKQLTAPVARHGSSIDAPGPAWAHFCPLPGLLPVAIPAGLRTLLAVIFSIDAPSFPLLDAIQLPKAQEADPQTDRYRTPRDFCVSERIAEARRERGALAAVAVASS